MHRPANQLSEDERQRLLEVANAPEFRSPPPSQIVPALADPVVSDWGEYSPRNRPSTACCGPQGSSSAGAVRGPPPGAPKAHRATAPNQLWSWDITYLATTVRGMFFYLYLILDVYSRKIVGLEVFEAESAEHATTVVGRAYLREGIAGQPLVLHSDNGAPMKGATLLRPCRSSVWCPPSAAPR